MVIHPPSRPQSETIAVSDPEAVRAWAAWLCVDESQLIRLVGIAGSSAGQIEYILGKNKWPRW